MSSFNLRITSVLFVALIILGGYIFINVNKENEINSSCVNVLYDSYKSLHFVSVSKYELQKHPENKFTEENRFFFTLYNDYTSNKNNKLIEKTIKGKDYRIAFKPCSENKWAYFALNKILHIDNKNYKLTGAEVNKIINEMDKWEVKITGTESLDKKTNI